MDAIRSGIDADNTGAFDKQFGSSAGYWLSQSSDAWYSQEPQQGVYICHLKISTDVRHVWHFVSFFTSFFTLKCVLVCGIADRVFGVYSCTFVYKSSWDGNPSRYYLLVNAYM